LAPAPALDGMIDAALYWTANLHPFRSGQAKGAALVASPWRKMTHLV
jgi:hypothetical protein